jgi:hypothetical protein
MKDAESRVHSALEEHVRLRYGTKDKTEWFRCSVEVARAAVIQACREVNTTHLSNPRGHTDSFVSEIRVGPHPELEYTQRPGDAHEGGAISKKRLANQVY